MAGESQVESVVVVPAAQGDSFMGLSQDNIDSAITTAGDYALNILFAVIVLVVGKFIARMVTRMIARSMKKAKTDSTLVVFTENITYVLAMIFVIIAALQTLGIPSASMVAAVGAAGLAIGLSLQGALSNFAAGILIICFKPYKIGDLLDAGGTIGTVRAIEMFTTTLVTPDNKTVIIPNSSMTSGKITNFTETDNLRVDLVFGAGYGDDIDKVKEVLMSVIKKDDRVLSTPEPFVGVVEHADSSVNFVCRPWTTTENYWAVFFDIQEAVKKAFDAEGVTIPFPQRDVHIHNA